MAQQNPPFRGPHCDAFTKNAEGEWVAKQDMTILGPFGPVNVKAGQPVDDEMQERLDDLCKGGVNAPDDFVHSNSLACHNRAHAGVRPLGHGAWFGPAREARESCL